jgi:ribosomal protein L40E
MSMHEAICPTCGAINHADGDTCWRCLAEVHPAARPAAARTADAATA